MKKDAARDALVQEARELLAAMETALLQIESDGPSRDAINALFRAAHTIKGSAGLFAFDGIVSFTHLLENVLDKVRNGILALDEAMMSLLLDCGDHISDLVDAIAEFKEEQDPDPVRRAELEASLNRLLERSENDNIASASPGNVQTPGPVGTPLIDVTRDGVPVANPYWHLSLRFHRDLLRDGLDPISFLNYLQTVGRIAYARVLDTGIPESDEMDAELCYLGFEIGLDSTAERTRIESVFEFVRDDSEICILSPHATVDDYRRWLQRMPDQDALGPVLVDLQVLSLQEWQQMFSDLDQANSTDANLQPRDGTAHHATDLPMASEPDLVTPVSSPLSSDRRPKGADGKKTAEQKFVKIEVSKLDQLIDLVGELVIAGAGASLVAKRRKDPHFDEATQLMSGLVEQIRDVALTMRMVQINEVFQRFPRLVRDMSREIGKDIELLITGADTELDKSMVDKIADPLMHIVRNAMDHGIEEATVRRAAGKSGTGMVRLNATHESGSVIIEVLDDGRGLDREKIFRKAVQQGLMAADATPSEKDIFRLIFEPGFSTADTVTSLSGRGVGMDVVKRNVDALRGEIDMFSDPGQGTMVRIRLPLTLAIISGFQIVVGGAVFVVPLELVVECINLSMHQVHHHVVTLRGEPLPFIPLRELFDLPQRDSPRKSLVIVQYGRMRAGLLVDQLLGECQAVIKPLGKLFSKVKGLSGSTILGDGRVALILDVPHLIAYSEKMEQADIRSNSINAQSDQ